MFEKGEMVYYGTAGVCRVGDICKSPFDKSDDRIYYVLEPSDFSVGTIIYAPAEGGKVLLRPLMTASEANELIAALADIPVIEPDNEKHRRDEYRSALRDGTPTSLARLIKTVYERRKKAVKIQKRISETDSEFDKNARRALAGELAYALGVSADEAEADINKALKG